MFTQNTVIWRGCGTPNKFKTLGFEERIVVWNWDGETIFVFWALCVTAVLPASDVNQLAINWRTKIYMVSIRDGVSGTIEGIKERKKKEARKEERKNRTKKGFLRPWREKMYKNIYAQIDTSLD